MTPLGCYHDNSFAVGAVSRKTEIPSFCLKPAPPTAANSMIGIKTIWELCLFQAGPFVSLEDCKWGHLFLMTERDWS